MGMPCYRRVAQVVVGEPKEDFKSKVRDLILADKQAKLDAKWNEQKEARLKNESEKKKEDGEAKKEDDDVKKEEVKEEVREEVEAEKKEEEEPKPVAELDEE